MISKLVIRLLSAIIALALITSACGRSRLSDREIRREQIRLNAENKKRELSIIKGEYSGTIDSGSNKNQPVVLHLDVIEAPFNDNGGIDPVMMPQLSGFLKFPYSGSVGREEYLGFKITRGEFDPKRSALELVVSHEQYGDIQLSMSVSPEKFTGNWQALALSMTGTMTLARGPTSPDNQSSNGTPAPVPVPDTQNQIAGQYLGFVNDDSRKIHYLATMEVRSNTASGQGIKITADLRLSRGSESSEFAIWKFDIVEFHPLTRRLTLRKDGVNESFIFVLDHGQLTGDWYSAVSGHMGEANLSRNSVSHSDFAVAKPYGGIHDICLKNFGGANLPSNSGLSLTITPDVTADGKIRAQSSLVFYYGPYGSPERTTCALELVDLDFVTGRFQGICRSLPNTEAMTATGFMTRTGFQGKLTASGATGAEIISGQCPDSKADEVHQ